MERNQNPEWRNCRRNFPIFLLSVIILFIFCLIEPGISQRFYISTKIFPLQPEHVHGPTIVELSNGDLLAGWFQGSGERWADDVRIVGSRLKKGQEQWSKPFLLADVPGFPDINPMMFIDGKKRLWLMWYTVIANQWETSQPKYRISKNYLNRPGAPLWDWQEVLYMKPGGAAERGIQPDDRFVKSIERQIKSYGAYLEKNGFLGNNEESVSRKKKLLKSWSDRILSLAKGENMLRSGRLRKSDGSWENKKLGYPYFRRMGWQTKNKPFILNNQRLIIPFYSDGFSFSLMAITDDWGATWQFSEPLVGGGNIQPSIVIKSDGTLVAYMRDNGPPPKRLQYAESKDGGMSWSTVHDSDLPNPGSGADIVTLKNGHWCLVYNDTENGRYSLAVSISDDEGKSWKWTRHLEMDKRGKLATQSHYPAVIQGMDGMIHTVYSFHRKDRKDGLAKTIKYARFNESWVQQGDPR